MSEKGNLNFLSIQVKFAFNLIKPAAIIFFASFFKIARKFLKAYWEAVQNAKINQSGIK